MELIFENKTIKTEKLVNITGFINYVDFVNIYITGIYNIANVNKMWFYTPEKMSLYYSHLTAPYFLIPDDEIDKAISLFNEVSISMNQKLTFVKVDKEIYKEFIAKKHFRHLSRFAEHNKVLTKFQCDDKFARLIPATDFELGSKTISYKSTGGLEYTFGVEIETCAGYVPAFQYSYPHPLNLGCTRDGSLRLEDGNEYGGEYVTGVLTGDLGMYNLYKSLEVLDKYTLSNELCGVHVHIGNIIFNKNFNVMAYLLGLKLQNELMTIVPHSRRNNPMCSMLKHHHIIDDIEEYGFNMGIDIAYDKLAFEIANQRDLSKIVNKANIHPGGRYTDRYARDIDLDKLYRYKIINFVPAFFNMKGGEPKKGEINKGIKSFTLEFRFFPSSTNYEEIHAWILLAMAFCYYAENHQGDILHNEKVTISDIINAAYSTRCINGKSIAVTLNDKVNAWKEMYKTSANDNHTYDSKYDYSKKTITEVSKIM